MRDEVNDVNAVYNVPHSAHKAIELDLLINMTDLTKASVAESRALRDSKGRLHQSSSSVGYEMGLPTITRVTRYMGPRPLICTSWS